MRRVLPTAVLLLLLAACTDEPIESGDEVNGPAGGTGLPAFASQPPRPKCAEVFVPGKVIRYDVNQAAVGCLDPDGGVQITGSHRCADGGRLYTIDSAAGGAPVGWGRDGEAYHAVSGELGADLAFKKAYDACLK